MIAYLMNYLKEKKILILGFGREGKSTYNLIREHLSEKDLTIADMKENFENDYDFLVKDNHAKFISGKKYLDNLNDYDLIIKSPGIAFNTIDVDNIKTKITSQMELFLEFFNNFTIGITGTKGKSTTSSLIYKVIKDFGKDTYLLGNIGKPIFEVLDEINENQIVVLEMSSHQLEFMKKSPNIALLLNIFEEHLDHYRSFQGYIDAKCSIFRNQNENDFFIYNGDNENVMKNIGTLKQNNVFVSINEENYNKKLDERNQNEHVCYLKDGYVYYDGEKIYSENEERNLKGTYNLNNIMFVLSVCKILNIDLSSAAKSISEFKTLPHRLEYAGTFDGVSYYDNSIATIPMATIEAVKALKNVNTLIIGGMDRGIDYEPFIKFLKDSSCKNIICMPKTGYDIFDEFASKNGNEINKLAKELKTENHNFYKAETMEEAVSIAKKVTEKNSICLLSPAAASYGFFKNFEEKGDLFKKLIEIK